MADLDALLKESQPVAGHRPWQRVVASEAVWRSAIDGLSAGAWSLAGLWGEPAAVHMAVLDGSRLGVISLDCPDGRYPSVGALHPPAIRLERAIADLYGLEAAGSPDHRPWLDHGRWGVRHPLGSRPASGEDSATASSYPFLRVEGEGLHQIPVGPVHAGIIEPGHFRFTANGETVARLEERLGYVHKGIDGLLQGADLVQAARLAGRTSGDSTVAYAYAFARAVEAALEVEAPPRARHLRALMAELERLANHFGDIGAICNDASFSLMQAHSAVLRERVLRFADATFGHRLMMDAIFPGGVAVDPTPGAVAKVGALIAEVRATFPRLVELYDGTASLQDRMVGTGTLHADLAKRFAPGGFVGRAAGRTFDARRALPYPPYDGLAFDVPVLAEGDVNARVWIRIREVAESLALIAAIVAGLPDGPVAIDLPAASGEGLAVVEGFRGDVLVWARIEDGRLARAHLRDPSWFQWPLLEAVIEGNIVADFPLCNKSFNCSYSGHDL
jgi:Ni,Fe-hydrogenase III large subunit